MIVRFKSFSTHVFPFMFLHSSISSHRLRERGKERGRVPLSLLYLFSLPIHLFFLLGGLQILWMTSSLCLLRLHRSLSLSYFTRLLSLLCQSKYACPEGVKREREHLFLHKSLHSQPFFPLFDITREQVSKRERETEGGGDEVEE